MGARPCSTAPVLLAIALAASAAAAPLETRIYQSFVDGDYARAAALIEEHLATFPNDPVMLYNGACAYSLLGRRDRSVLYLSRAVDAGLSDVDRITRDPDLAAIRDHPTYEALVQRLRRPQRRPEMDALAAWRALYGNDRYRYERDEERLIAYATALDSTAHGEMRLMIERQADHLAATLFDARPDTCLLVAVPTPDDGRRLFKSDNAGGIYEHDKRRLIAREIGGSLRHELVHAMHYVHMDRIGQRHPLWAQEGLAALYESYVLDDDGTIVFLPNERHNVVRGLALAGKLASWRVLFRLSDQQFMARAPEHYPQVRSIFEFLADRGVLERWYAALVETFPLDPTGASAFRACFDQPLEDVERAWRQWVLARPRFDNHIELGDAALGIETRLHSSNDGVRVTRVLPGSAAAAGGLRPGDVIVAVDGKPTRSLAELRAIIGARAVGETVSIRARREREYFTVEVPLRPLRSSIW